MSVVFHSRKEDKFMPCRIGITTDPQGRKRQWEAQHPNLSGWDVLRVCNSKADAQNWENHLAQQHGCVAEPGGAGAENATWYVYKFNY